MNDRSHHAEWLSLIDVSGPFLAETVLNDAFPQGLEGLDAEKKRFVRQAYDEWREALDLNDSEFPKIHRAWIEHVLKRALELDENDNGDILKSGAKLPEILRCDIPERGVSLLPDYAVIENRENGRALLLIVSYGEETNLMEPLGDDGYVTSPAERMVELCRGAGVRLGLVTNGERWMFVDAPVGGLTSFASWYARLWNQEPLTLQAFVNLLGIRRFFVDRSQQLPALLDDSLKYQDEVTDALGEQVTRAVEVLIQALDRADIDRDRELLDGIEPAEIYEAGLTVMMRIVFLLSAEERELLLLGDERYEASYAVSTLRIQLRNESEEILERRWDAWSRLLSIFRAVFGGVDHEEMRLPALGGSLFDPDRFPFLEGRKRGSHWKNALATPLPIDNRTVLYLLEAVQVFRGRTLSYLTLDIEQIGYVYEGLLERTVVRAKEVTLDLDATKNAKNPWVSLPELDDAAASGRPALQALLKERSGCSAARVHNDLDRPIDEADAERLLTACRADVTLRNRIKPYFKLLRTDRWGYPIVYPKGAFMVAAGTDRRETGTHYTPKSFTEAIVKEALEPLVYDGRAQGLKRENWKLKSPASLLDLKICDPAMGSGAFLVQVCRWLAERLVEAWSAAEEKGSFLTADGEVVDAIGSHEPLRKDAEERVLTAQRLIAERCLYGVDMNPLAVELAKLSLWLVTLAKGRPFGFLDHNFRNGDSLLGITRLEQLDYLETNPGRGSVRKLFAAHIDQAVSQAIALRTELRNRPIRDIRDVEVMAQLDEEARRELVLPELIADAFIGQVLAASGKVADTTALSVEAGQALDGDNLAMTSLSRRAGEDLAHGKLKRKPLHWPLEFPEVFMRDNHGFDAIVGNPPFLGGKLITGALGARYQKYLVKHVTASHPASVDLVVHFMIRIAALLGHSGFIGLLGRRSINEGNNREVGLRQLLTDDMTAYLVNTNIAWPGKASVVVHQLHFVRGVWTASNLLNGTAVGAISSELGSVESWAPQKLDENLGRMFQGSILAGEGFKIDSEMAQSLIIADEKYRDVLFPFIIGDTINKDPLCLPICWVIFFWDWSEEDARNYESAFLQVEESVRLERQRRKPNGEYHYRRPQPQRWWQYGEKRPGLYHALGRGTLFKSHPKGWTPSSDAPTNVLAVSTSITKYPAFTYLPSDFVYSNTLCLLVDDRFAVFAALSSDIHAIWAWGQKTTRQADMESMRYAHGNIFETFPFPGDMLDSGDEELEALGKLFFANRQKLMQDGAVGLTKFYNNFHNPSETNASLVELRHLQSKMNQTVRARYGWDDLDLTCQFCEVSYLPVGKNVRFTIGEEVRHEVLRRLSILNRDRVAKRAESDPVSPKEDLIFEDDLFAEVRINV
jgi:hypothetical protein